MTVTSCAGKLCISYSCSTIPLTDFHELLSFSELGDLITTTICNTVRPQLNSDGFNPAHDDTLSQLIFKMAAQKAVLKLFNTSYEHFYNLKLLYSVYLSQTL